MRVGADECRMMVIVKPSEAITVRKPQEAVTACFESHCESADIISVLV